MVYGHFFETGFGRPNRPRVAWLQANFAGRRWSRLVSYWRSRRGSWRVPISTGRAVPLPGDSAAERKSFGGVEPSSSTLGVQFPPPVCPETGWPDKDFGPIPGWYDATRDRRGFAGARAPSEAVGGAAARLSRPLRGRHWCTRLVFLWTPPVGPLGVPGERDRVP